MEDESVYVTEKDIAELKHKWLKCSKNITKLTVISLENYNQGEVIISFVFKVNLYTLSQ